MESTITTAAAALNTDVFYDILSDIEKEKCVLIIGPDLIDFGEKSFFEIMCEELQKDAQYCELLDLSPQYVFSHEELLELKPTAKEMTLLRYMERFYSRQTQYDEPFRKISHIPFHLIISFLPDTRLKKTFEQQHLDFTYSHYPLEEIPKQLDRPTMKTPLVYNILGDFSEGDVIITFDHLFQYLSGIMGKRELPDAMQEAFKKARTFLFLGVHFERWYVQLILRIITTKDKKDKYSILKSESGSDVYTFMARRLKLNFVPIQPIDFLNQLYEKCAERGMLKKIEKPIACKTFLSYSHIDKADALKIAEKLKEKNIEVIRDEESMPIGYEIDKFIKTINDVDCVLAVISKNSLRSPWVIKEIITTIRESEVLLLPCYLDASFQDKDFIIEAEKLVDEQLARINEKIVLRGRSSTQDLFNEYNQWTEYINTLPIVLAELKKRYCMPLNQHDFENAIEKIADNILTKTN